MNAGRYTERRSPIATHIAYSFCNFVARETMEPRFPIIRGTALGSIAPDRKCALADRRNADSRPSKCVMPYTLSNGVKHERPQRSGLLRILRGRTASRTSALPRPALPASHGTLE